MEPKLDLAHHSGPNIKLHANSSSQAWRYSTGHEAFSRDMVTEEPKTYPFLPNYLDVAYDTQPGKSKAVALLHEKNDATKEKDVKADKDHLHMQLVAPIMPSTTNEFFASPTQVELARHSIACPSFPYSDPYYGGAYPARGPQPLEQYPHGLGVQSARMVLPLQMAEEPVYVNAKQYHGILRRRQSRAKAELERKFIRVRKPYLHESRHLHAMRRARGCGGRFLTTKKPDNTAAKTSTDNHTVGSEHKTMSSNNLFGIADSTSNSQEILFNPHPPNTHSNSSGNNKPYSQVQEFELSSYQSLSGDVRENGGNYSVQQSERFNFNGVLRALTIK